MANNIKLCGLEDISLEVIAGSKPRPDHPDVWRADVGVKRLQKAADKGSYFLFVYPENRNTIVYGISARELQDFCRNGLVSINSNGVKYELYIRYKSGRVYKSISEESFVFQLYSKKIFPQNV